jgi:hypothetical protein
MTRLKMTRSVAAGLGEIFRYLHQQLEGPAVFKATIFDELLAER